MSFCDCLVLDLFPMKQRDLVVCFCGGLGLRSRNVFGNESQCQKYFTDKKVIWTIGFFETLKSKVDVRGPYCRKAREDPGFSEKVK